MLSNTLMNEVKYSYFSFFRFFINVNFIFPTNFINLYIVYPPNLYYIFILFVCVGIFDLQNLNWQRQMKHFVPINTHK